MASIIKSIFRNPSAAAAVLPETAQSRESIRTFRVFCSVMKSELTSAPDALAKRGGAIQILSQTEKDELGRMVSQLKDWPISVQVNYLRKMAVRLPMHWMSCFLQKVYELEESIPKLAAVTAVIQRYQADKIFLYALLQSLKDVDREDFKQIAKVNAHIILSS